MWGETVRTSLTQNSDKWQIHLVLKQCALAEHILRRVQSDVTGLNRTELNYHGLVFDELTNGQSVMHYSRHRLITASVVRDYNTRL